MIEEIAILLNTVDAALLLEELFVLLHVRTLALLHLGELDFRQRLGRVFLFIWLNQFLLQIL